MDLQLKGLNALVCGASQGLGLAIAEALAAEGCRVGLLARNAARLEAHVARLAAAGREAVALPADMGDWPSLTRALENFGQPAILVNNSGGPRPTDVTSVDADLWRRQFEETALNQMRLTAAVLPAMRRAKFGRVLSVMSTGVAEPFAGLVLGNALRSALANWMKTLSFDVAADGITVNMLLPGSIATARIDELNAAAARHRGITIDQVAAEAAGEIPAGRYGEPQEFADIATFLASPRASYITGQMIRVDGGATRSW
jgi:3-oxoacyl-[acyl-carrier protein] reductase